MCLHVMRPSRCGWCNGKRSECAAAKQRGSTGLYGKRTQRWSQTKDIMHYATFCLAAGYDVAEEAGQATTLFHWRLVRLKGSLNLTSQLFNMASVRHHGASWVKHMRLSLTPERYHSAFAPGTGTLESVSLFLCSPPKSLPSRTSCRFKLHSIFGVKASSQLPTTARALL